MRRPSINSRRDWRKRSPICKTLDRKAIDLSAEREITFPLGPRTGHMNGADYLIHFLLPNFHFHVTAAYAILRHCGVDIAKSDYFGAIPIEMT